MKKWEVDVDGVKHVIQYKAGITRKIIVDGEKYKAKSSNMFINVIDYGITFGNTDCKLVVIGNKADLAVNGTFLGSQKPYEPVSNVASWVWIFVGLSILGGYLIAGLLSLLVGILGSMLYIQFGIQKKNGKVIGSFVACTVIQLLILFALASILY
ncbi:MULTISPECIES: hypothetical protein [Clostridium]|jgi:hypothetical protein|uniref:Uncharacterized protein n=1 Tax=Clostridium saccharoperbutylacetonicum N1-4(HMT) TaxID=931276 RepID=M1MNH7_9CLOT|nr:MULTISPECIES: hypothetical protein [Clostridium]AGF56256.1 hypothetical protein Cspa_c24910 [Clostridium saccharoperbutylacetonicum N1-4(HMT)]AQR94996.1 hypothetical protein CLSAP_23100 [Clostridium saccharoperbutylacetonicum]NRT63001.1 hypothetical protein [Clostridium saccharoperbutylacetonicum]NSB26358.1 hypothetical protein [Clostridium saccharoperbutylacetonicum]NSB30840.1 hypothetical protein [Clostridium saccharoperbutylacetonicum]